MQKFFLHRDCPVYRLSENSLMLDGENFRLQVSVRADGSAAGVFEPDSFNFPPREFELPAHFSEAGEAALLDAALLVAKEKNEQIAAQCRRLLQAALETEEGNA